MRKSDGRARLLPSRTYRQIVKSANRQAEKLWSLEGCAPAQPPKIFRSCRSMTLQQRSCAAEFVQIFGRAG
jgi:hypothetical protein